MPAVTFAQVVAALEPWRRLHRRDAWRPMTAERDAGPAVSKFGGVPLLPPGEPWPLCSGCGRPLHLFIQLDLATLPPGFDRPARAGLLQLFYCTAAGECDAEMDAWQPFAAGAKVCRVIDRAGASAPAAPPPGFEPFPEQAILDWERFDDYPHPQEFPSLGISLSYDFSKMSQGVLTATVAWPAGGVRFDAVPDRSDGPGLAEAISMPAPKDKLGGWPHWIQGAEYPACPRCGGRMQYLLQIDSEDHVPFMFGDVGTAHLTQCPTHPDVLAFAWACS